MMCMAGFPMLSSGDEIGQLNGYGYHDDPALREDSRNIHRTPFNWENAALRTQKGTVQQRVWDGLRQLERLRAEEPCFGPKAAVTTWDPHNRHVLAIVRRFEGQTLACLFNFSGEKQEISLDAMPWEFTDLLTGEKTRCDRRTLEPYQYAICKHDLRDR
jgi:amylosucrase